MDCTMCCEVQNFYEMQYFYKLTAACVCTPDECSYSCQAFCNNPTTLPPGDCQDCAVQAMTAGSCSSVIMECLGDVACAPALQCLLACP